MVIKIIIYLAVLLLAIPAGYWIAWLARDELVKGRRWFVSLIVLSMLGIVGFAFVGDYEEMLALLAIMVISFIAYRKSFDKNWVVAWGRA